MAKALHKPGDEWNRRKFNLDDPNASEIHPHFRIISEGKELKADDGNLFPISLETLRAATIRSLCLCFEREPGTDKVSILKAEIYRTILAAIPELGIRESDEVELFDVFVRGARRCEQRPTERITPEMFDISEEQREELRRLIQYHKVKEPPLRMDLIRQVFLRQAHR